MPKAKLTKRVVDGAVPGTKQVLIWDTEVQGFGLRVTPANAKSYILNYRISTGRERRHTIGRHGSPWTCDAARGEALKLLRGLASGIDPLDAKSDARAATTVADLIAQYLTDGPTELPNKKASSWERDTSGLRRHVLPLIGTKPIKALTASDLARLQADIAAGKSAADVKTGPRGRAIIRGGRATASRTLAVVGAMLEFAVRRGMISSNPAKGVKLLKVENRERFLSEREILLIADAMMLLETEGALNATMAVAIRLLMLTGCRRDEIRTLRWSWVDLDRGCIRLPDSKTGAKIVPLASSAADLLRDLPRRSDFVLPSSRADGPIVGIQKAWDRVRRRATEIGRERAVELGEPVTRAPDLTAVRLHDLRHTFASVAVASGASLYLVGKALGHRQASTTQIYAHVGDDPLRALADRTGAQIAAAMQADMRHTAAQKVEAL